MNTNLTPKVLVRVQHHPSRWGNTLKRLLDGLEEMEVEVISHESEPPNPWACYQKCLSFIPEEVTHILVIQDDAIVCDKFPLAVNQIATAYLDNPVCLFLGGLPKKTGAAALRAMKEGRHYCQVHRYDFVPVVAVLWPKEKAQEFLAWAEHSQIPGWPNPRSDDAVVGSWMRHTKQAIYATCPSLVEHPDDVPSTVGKRARAGADKGRVALKYIGDSDPLEFDW